MGADHRPFARAAQLLEDMRAVRRRETVHRSDDNSRRKVQNVRGGSCLDGTIHTDFSHVEVNTAQVNLTRFLLLFPEKREFFLENADLFNLVPYGWSGDVGVDGETRIGTYGRVDGYWLRSDAAGTTGQARYLETGWPSPRMRADLSALDLQDGFRADVGFVPRPAIHKYYASLRVPVYPAWAQAAGLSEIAIGGFADYFTGSDGRFQTARTGDSGSHAPGFDEGDVDA